MFSNYLKTTIRNLIKTKLFSAVNILGLAIGMTACLLILHYVSFEKSYDKFHEAGERIYRLRYERSSAEGKTVKFASCTAPAATFIRERYPVGKLQRTCPVLRAPEIALFFETGDVLEHGDLGDAEHVGELLHRRGITILPLVVPDEREDSQLFRRQLGELSSWHHSSP